MFCCIYLPFVTQLAVGGSMIQQSLTGPNMLYRICISPCLWGPQSPFLVVNRTVHIVYNDQSKHKELPTKFKPSGRRNKCRRFGEAKQETKPQDLHCRSAARGMTARQFLSESHLFPMLLIRIISVKFPFEARTQSFANTLFSSRNISVRKAACMPETSGPSHLARLRTI